MTHKASTASATRLSAELEVTNALLFILLTSDASTRK